MLVWLACIVCTVVLVPIVYKYYYSREEGFQTPPQSPPSNAIRCNFIKTSRTSVEEALALHVKNNNTTYINPLKEVIQGLNTELINAGCTV